MTNAEINAACKGAAQGKNVDRVAVLDSLPRESDGKVTIVRVRDKTRHRVTPEEATVFLIREEFVLPV